MTAKEIWYVWSGKGSPPKGVKKALCQFEVLIDDERYFGSIDSAWDWFGDKPFIQAYTIGETRERVKCDECCGQGGFYVLYSYGGSVEDCSDCKGRGYI
jgi:hypothetical protein